MKSIVMLRVILLASLVGMVACSPGASRNPLLRLLPQDMEALGYGLYSPVERWEVALGAAMTVTQADGADTYLYWPDVGIAVFTHPHFEMQHLKPRSERKVTSIVLALRESIQPFPAPAPESQRVHFNRTAAITVDGTSISSLTLARWKQFLGEPERVDGKVVLFKHRRFLVLPDTATHLYLEDGVPVAVEVREDRALSHYD
jgi:hypothetical protein